MGKLLYELKKGGFKDAVGAGIDTWDDYIAQPEINLSKGEADRLVQIYEQFVCRFGLTEKQMSEIPIKNLHYLLPIVKRQRDSHDEGTLELIESASVLSQKDFKLRVGEIKYDGNLTYEYMVMKRCNETGSLSKVHDISSKAIQDVFGI